MGHQNIEYELLTLHRTLLRFNRVSNDSQYNVLLSTCFHSVLVLQFERDGVCHLPEMIHIYIVGSRYFVTNLRCHVTFVGFVQ